MARDSLEALTRLIEVIALEQRPGRLKPAKHPQVVAISSAAGAGGNDVARMLAEALGIPLFDKEILNAVAEEAHVDRQVLERLDERVDGLRGAWLRSLLTGENLFKEPYRRNLVNAILGIACHSGVILGRGAAFVLAHQPVLRIRVVGTLDRCAARWAAENEMELSAARKEVSRIDEKRKEFVRTLYGQDIDAPTAYDLLVNSDRINLASIVEFALKAMKDVATRGAEVPMA